MLIPVARGGFLPLLLASLVLGFALGAVYDLFRIRRAAFRLSVGRPTEGHGFRAFFFRHLWRIDGWLCFLEDLLFFLFGTVVFILVDFKLWFGIPRWYAYGAALAGAVLYRVTVGRLVMKVSEGVIRFVVSVFRLLRNRILLPLRRAIGSRMVRLCESLRRKRAQAYTDAVESAVLTSLSRLGGQ